MQTAATMYKIWTNSQARVNKRQKDMDKKKPRKWMGAKASNKWGSVCKKNNLSDGSVANPLRAILLQQSLGYLKWKNK
jgi:hypothetical protein